MTKSIILYTDGAGGKIKGQKDIHPIGWGVIALFNDEKVELKGFYHVHPRFRDDFEFFAFFEAVKYARAQGFTVSEMSFYIDDAALAYAGFRLHPENYCSPSINRSFMQRLTGVAEEFYTPELLADVIACLKHGRITKLKGHRFCVYQNRVDYLATAGVYEAHHGKRKKVKPFERWLKNGFKYFVGIGEERRWYPPFAYDNSTK